MKTSILRVIPSSLPPLDPNFKPAVLGNRAFLKAVDASGKSEELLIGLSRNDGAFSVHRTRIFSKDSPQFGENFPFVERILKTLLWQKGGYRICVSGPVEIADFLKGVCSPSGARAFDIGMMSRIYEQPFCVEHVDAAAFPAENEKSHPKGGHLNGCRIGFDAGGSDRKVAAIVDGKAVYSEEVMWNPKGEKDPEYHYRGITDALKAAASRMPRVDAIGVSAAGVYINNRVMVASLFRGVPPDLFERRVKNMFLDIQKEWNNVPIQVCNDGDVTALAGSMTLKTGSVLGIAMGTSEAAGYVTKDGFLTEWLNELAFVPIDYNPSGPVDEWSGDAGVGSQYFCQTGAIRLAAAAGVDLGTDKTPAEKLKTIQGLLEKGDRRVPDIFESLGCYLGYAIAGYADLYDIRHILLLGRVTSGEGGNIMTTRARKILDEEFPSISRNISLHLPEEESERRVGQAIAAASLPEIR